MRLPKVIKIKGKPWRIQSVQSLRIPDGGGFAMGLCDPASRTISIDADLKGRAFLSTFLHELNHAIMFETHILLDITIEEVIVEGFSDVYSDLFKLSLK